MAVRSHRYLSGIRARSRSCAAVPVSVVRAIAARTAAERRWKRIMMRILGSGSVSRPRRGRGGQGTNRRSRVGLACVLGAALVCGRPGAPSKPFTFSILEDYDKGQPLAEIERDFELFQELGIYTWRGSLGWDDYEPEPGRYDLAWLHEFALRAAHHGIDLRPYVAYTPEWAAGGADADGQSWHQPPRDLQRGERPAVVGGHVDRLRAHAHRGRLVGARVRTVRDPARRTRVARHR